MLNERGNCPRSYTKVDEQDFALRISAAHLNDCVMAGFSLRRLLMGGGHPDAQNLILAIVANWGIPYP